MLPFLLDSRDSEALSHCVDIVSAQSVPGSVTASGTAVNSMLFFMLLYFIIVP